MQDQIKMNKNIIIRNFGVGKILIFFKEVSYAYQGWIYLIKK